MRILIRTDASPEIGGGHLMRCLTLAGEAARRGHSVHFIVNAGELSQKVLAQGHSLTEQPPQTHQTDTSTPHAHWLTTTWQTDASVTAKVAASFAADWLVWDHYGLDARWVDAVRQIAPNLRVLALDDLDDRPLGSDIVLDPAHMEGEIRKYPVPVMLHGPAYALLRPEFAALRKAALARRAGPVKRVLIAPGMMDAAGLAPLALDALNGTGLKAEVVMGSMAQSVDRVREMVAYNPDWTLTLDATDMAVRMTAADLCIGAGGGTSWELCCLGLPSVVVAVAENQKMGVAILARRGAAVSLDLGRLRSGGLGIAVTEAVANAQKMSVAAAQLCDGLGAGRLMDVLDADLRPLVLDDADLLFGWRNQPHIRAASHDKTTLIWDDHLDWVKRTIARDDGLWRVYREDGQDVGFVSAVDQGSGRWKWSFYVGAAVAPRGTGGRMLSTFLSLLASRPDCGEVEGEVLAENSTSRALHNRLGFTAVPHDDDSVLVFRKRV